MRRLRARLAFPPNQIAVGLAVRAVLAIALPLTVFRLIGLPLAGLFFAIGALQIAISDSGGPYRDRLFSISLLCLTLPEIYLLGAQIGNVWWAAALAMFALAFLGGLLRALGTMGLPLGMVMGATFLMGTFTQASAAAALVQTGWFLAGSVWTLALVLAAWRLRPYLALQRETGSALDAAARLLAAVPTARGKTLSAKELAVRAGIEQARNALGVTRAMAPATNPALTRLWTLLYVSSRLTVLAMTLADLRAGFARNREALAALDAATLAISRAAAGAARAVIKSHGWEPGEEVGEKIGTLAGLQTADSGLAAARTVALEAFRAGTARLQQAAEAGAFLSRSRPRRTADWLPKLAPVQRVRELLHTLRAQWTLRSTLFRHALRLGVVAGGAMAIEVYWRLPHGIWLVLTVLVVMQPDFGATRLRAVARAAGTLAGVFVAGAVLVAFPTPAGREAAVAVLVFFTVFTIRFHYGFFVACLTPLVIILLALYDPSQGWNFVFERAGETLGGIVLAIVGAHLLWPAWGGRRVPARFAEALTAAARYLDASFKAAATGDGFCATVLDARREAELAAVNVEAALQTMLAEPRRIVGERTRFFQLNAHFEHLMRHLGAFGARLDIGLERLPALAPLADDWAAGLAAAAGTLGGKATPATGIRLAAPPDIASAPPGIPHLITLIGVTADTLVEEADSLTPPSG